MSQIINKLCFWSVYALCIRFVFAEHAASSTRQTTEDGDEGITCKRVLITGINGMIGSHVAQALVRATKEEKKCYDIYGLVRPRSDLSSLRGIMPNIKFLRGDLMDSESMQDAVATSKPHYVYHFAAQAINGISFNMPRMTLDTNIQGTLNLFEGIRLLKTKTKPRVLVAGSSTEYGLTADEVKGPLSEEAAMMPISPYGISKLTTEKLANLYNHSYDIPTITARIFIHVGVGGTDSLAIHEFSKQIALAEIGKGSTVITHGNLNTARDITDARDSADIMVKLLETGVPGEAYNVGSGTTTTIAHLLETVMSMAKVHMTHQSLESKFRQFDEAILVADNRKLCALTNWVPSTNMNATILSILNFWREKVNLLYGGSSGNSREMGECPFGDIDLFLPVTDKGYGFERTNMLFNSMSIFMPCWNTLHLLVDRPAAVKALAWVSAIQGQGRKAALHVVDYPDDVPVVNSRYTLQTWAMMWADEYAHKTRSVAKYIMFLDGDTVFGAPVTCSSIFDPQGRIYHAGWDMGRIQPQLIPACKDMLGSECAVSYMSFFPFTLPMDAFPRMRAFISQHLFRDEKVSFNEAFSRWAKTVNLEMFSQFVVMGNYMRDFEQDKVHQIFCEHIHSPKWSSSNCKDMVPAAAHFGLGTSYYLGGGGASYRTAMGNITVRYGPSYVEAAEKLISEGFCRQTFYTQGIVHELCKDVALNGVPEDIDLYKGMRAIPPSQVKDRYTAESPKGGLCSSRFGQNISRVGVRV